MNTYGQEVFNYLTETENYRSAKQVASQIGQIDDKLRSDFWQAVKESVINKMQNAGVGNWEVDLSLSDQWFSVHRKGWESFGVNVDQLFGRPDFGIDCASNAYDRVKVNELIDPIKKAEGFGDRNVNHWPIYRAIGLDFSQQATLESILPERRAGTVERVAGLFEDFIKKYSVVLDRIESEAKLSK